MFKVACIQICSNNDIKENLDKVLTFVKQSISNGAEFILTPEVTSLFFSNKLDLLSKISTMQEDIFVKEFKRICKESNKWILLGSLLIKQSKNSVVNRSILHLFAVIKQRNSLLASNSEWQESLHVYDCVHPPAILANVKSLFASEI